MSTEALRTIIQSYLETNFEGILEMIDAGEGPIRILSNIGAIYLLLSWEDYLTSFGCHHSPEELDMLEETYKKG